METVRMAKSRPKKRTNQNARIYLKTTVPYDNGGITVITIEFLIEMSVHFAKHGPAQTTPQKFENATINGHFGFEFEENWVREIT